MLPGPPLFNFGPDCTVYIESVTRKLFFGRGFKVYKYFLRLGLLWHKNNTKITKGTTPKLSTLEEFKQCLIGWSEKKLFSKSKNV